MARTSTPRTQSTAAVVRQWIDTHPSVKECLQKGLVNLSALSRRILEEKDLDQPEAVLMACRRYRGGPQADTEDRIRRTLSRSRIEITTGVGIVTLRNEWRIYAQLQQVFRGAVQQGHIPKLIQGSKAITVITDEATARSLKQEMTGERLLDYRPGVVEISVTSPETIRSTPGVMAYLTGALASNGINLVETMSTYTDTIFVVEPAMMMRAFEILSLSIRTD